MQDRLSIYLGILTKNLDSYKYSNTYSLKDKSESKIVFLYLD